MFNAIVGFFREIGGAIATAWSEAKTLERINMVFMAVTAVTGVKGFLQARQMMSKGQDIMANKTAAGGKIPVIYGTRRVGAQIVYMDTAQNRSKDLFVVYAISVGECEEILGRTIEIDGNSILDGNIYKGGGYVGSDKISSGNGSLNTASQVGDNQYSQAGTLGTDPTKRYSFVFNLHHGASSQTADPMLRASIPTEWTTNHKLNGICYIAASFDYDKKGMYKGVPQITVQVKGKKVFDPRTSTTAWSSNPALCFLDYIQNDEYGKGLATSQINMTTISAAATKCEVEVDQPYYNDTYQDLTWSGTAGNDFIVINDNDDWWQNKVDEVIDIRDSNDASIFSNPVSITGSTRYQYYDSVQENRLYIDDVLANSYTNEAGNARAKVKRFHCNGYIDTNKNVMDNAKELLANMRGIFLYIDGKYELQIEDTGTSTFSITDDHIIADAGISVDYGNKDKKANKVVIEFFNANKKYELDTATVLHDASPEYYSDDGEVLEVKAEFPYVTDPYIAYNMGKAILTRSRNQTTMQFLGTPEMYKLNVGDIVDLTYLPLSFNGKVCRVEALELQANGLVSVSLIEYFDVYTWEVPAQEPVEIIAHPPSIGALHPPEASSIVFTDTDASAINRPTLTWDEPTDFPVRQYRVDVVDTANPPVQVFSKLVDTNSVDLSFLAVGNYNANITSFNGVGIESNAVVKPFTIGDPPTATEDIQNNAVTNAKVNDLSADKIDTGVLNLGSESGMAVRQTKTSYSSTATGFWLGNDGGTPKFNIGTSTNYLQFDGSNLQISGNISATTGTIGGFTVGDNYLRAGTGTTRISLSTVDGIHLGNNTFASAPFKVALNGDLTASSATIDGDITATTLTVEEANIQSLKLTLGGGILQDGSNNDLTVLNVINPDFPVDGLLHYFPLNGFSDPNDTTPADVIDVVSDVTGVITGSNGSFATDSPNGQSYVNGATTGITLLSNAQANTWQSTTGDYTVALWFKSTTESGDVAGRIIGRDASDFWSLALGQSETGNQTVRLYTDGEVVSWDGASANEWHHVAMVVNGTTSAKLYVDGVLRATDTNINFTTEPRPVVLGCNTESSINTASNVFFGKFSDVRFYTKAITDKQVQSLYMNPAGGLPAKIEGDLFVTNTITADKLDVNTLDSISANLGSITAGDIDIGGGDFTVSATGVMTATGATISGNVTTTTLVVTEDADVIGNLKATSLASNIVKIGNLHQEVWNEIDARTATTQNGFYDEFTSAGGVGYIGVEKNFELLGSGSNGYLVNANNITLRGGSVSIVGSSTTQFTGTALQFTAQYQYKLTSGSTWTNTGSSVTATADVAESGGIYYYEVDADPDAQITGLTAGSYYQFRLKITPVVTNNVFRVSPTGAADSNGITIIFEAQQSSTSTGTGAGTVTSVTAGDGLSGGTITSSGTLAVDSTVVRTTGTQSIAGDKTFNNDIIIQGNLDVQGTTTTVNTDDLNVKDKNITLNYSTGDSSASANGAGITIQDAVSATQDATLTWNTSTDRFNFSHGLDFPDSALLAFGDGTDLRILHNGTNSVFSNYTGNLDFKNFADDTDIRFWSDDGSGSSAIYFRLDGSEATASQLITRWDDDSRIALGSTNDLQLYHDGSNSYIKENGTGNLYLQGTSLVLTNSVGVNYLVAYDGGSVNLYHNANQKLATTSTGIDVTGTITSSSDIILSGDATQVRFTSTLGPQGFEFGDTEANPNFRIYYRTSPNTLTFENNGESAKHTFDLSGNYTAGGSVIVGTSLEMSGGVDNSIDFRGTGTDTLTRKFAYEASDDHYVTNRHGGGDLVLMSNNGTNGGETVRIRLQGGSGTQDIDITNANLDMNSNNINNVGTINSGAIDVTGTVTADGATIAGTLELDSNNLDHTALSPQYNMIESDITGNNTQFLQVGGDLRIRTIDDSKANPVERLRIDHASGDISFYDNTGSTQGLFWDASAEALGLGTTSPSAVLTVDGTTKTFGDSGITLKRTGSVTGEADIILAGVSGSEALSFRVNDSEKFRVQNNGSVGIGDSSPDAKLTVQGDVLARDEFRGEVVDYAANQDAPYLIASTSGYTGATTNWNTYGFQHRIKSNSGGSPRITIDTAIGEAFTVTNNNRVGINTDSPSQALEVAGSIQIGGNATFTGTINSDAITSTGYITASSANGGVSLTHNDGYGNANVTFNHRSGVPEQNGQAARIAVNTDGTGTQGIIEFEVSASDVTSGTSVNLTTAMVLAHDFVEIPQYIYHYNDTDTYLRFSNDRVRLFAGGASVFDGSGQDIRLGNKVQIGDTTNQNQYGFLQVNQEANNDESGIAILDSTDARSMRLWVDDSNSYINSGNGGAAPLILNEAITVSSGGNLTGVGTISSSNITVNDNAEIRLSELASNGSNYVAIKSPSSLGVNTTYELPSTYPANSGAVLISTTAGELSWSSNTVSTYTNGATGSGRIITSNGASSIEAETNLTYDNTTLKIANTGAVLEIGNATAAQPIIRLKTNSNGLPRIVFNDGSDQAYIQYGHGSLNGEKLTISSGATEFTGTITSLVNANRFFKYRSGSIADFEVSSDNNSNSVMTVTGTGTADIFKVRDNTNDVFTIADGGNATFAGDVSLTTGDLAVEGTIELGNNYIIPNTDGTAGQVLKYPPAGGSSALVWSDIDTGAVTSISNNANNRILTATGGTTINGESGLTFDGATLGVVGDISLGDNKKIYLGTGNDTEIYFDGSNSYFLGTGNTFYTGATSVSLATGVGVGSQTYLTADYSNGVKLYHEGSLKAQTQDDGFKVTGEIRGTQFAYSYYNSTSTTLTTSYAVINLDTLQASTGISGIAVASNVVTISRTGTFMITMDVVTDVTSGAGRTESEAQLYKNGSAVTGTFVGMYNRTAGRGLSTGSATTMISVTSGDTFEIRAKKTGTDTVVTSVGGTRLTFLQVG